MRAALRVFTTGRSSVICACALVLACLLSLGTSSYAQFGYAYSTNSGDWNNAAIWNTPPVDGLQAFVMGNDTVTFQSGDSYTGAFNFGFWGSLLIGASDAFIAGNGGTGTLNITGGTLTTGGWAVGAGAAGTINQSGGTFNAIGSQMLFGWGASATMNISGGTMNMTGAGTWRIGHTASSSINVTDSGVANFTGGMAVAAFSAINANGGTVNISNATIDIAAGSQLRATNGGSINLNGGNTFTGDGGFVLGGASAVNVNSGTNTFAGEVSLAANATITAGSGTSLTLNPGTGAAVSLTAGRTLTIGGPGSVLVGGAITGTGNLILAGATSAGQNGTVTLSGSNSFSGFLQAGGGFGTTLRVGHDNALGAGTVFVGQNLLLTSDGAATRTIGNTVNLANIAYYGDATGTGDLIFTGSNVATGNQRIMVVSNSTTISGVVSGTGGLDKRGAGTLTLSGNNTYELGATLNVGTLRVGHDNALGTGTLTFNSGIFASSDSNSRTITNAITMGGNVQLGDATGTGSLILGNINLGTATRTLTVGNSTIVGGSISNTAGLTKEGAGTLRLVASNSYDGVTTVAAGVLRVSDSNALGSTNAGTVVQSGAQLRLFAGSEGATSYGNGEALTISGTGGDFLGALRSGVSGETNTYQGKVTLADDATINAGGGTLLILDVSSGEAVDLGANTVTFIGQGSHTVNDGIVGSGGISKTGTGTLTLAASSGFSGGTSLGEGTLRLDHANAAGSGTITQLTNTFLQINTTGTVANAMSIFNVQTMQSVTLSGNKTLNNATYTVDPGTITTESGNLSGTGGITKQGAGTLLVTGNNSFTGAVAVNEGVLELASTVGGGAASTVSVSVATNAILLLSQSQQVNNTATVSLSGGTITRGAGVSEVFGNLNITGSGILDFGTGAAGHLTFGTYQDNEATPSALLTLNNFLPGNSFTFSSTSFSTNSVGSYFTFGTGFVNSSITNDGSTFTITAIPEPSTYVAAAGLLGLLVLSLRRRAVSRPTQD